MRLSRDFHSAMAAGIRGRLKLAEKVVWGTTAVKKVHSQI